MHRRKGVRQGKKGRAREGAMTVAFAIVSTVGAA